MNGAPSPAVEWASTVTPKHYRRHRAELDPLVLVLVPSYAAQVAARIDAVERAVELRRDELFAEAPFVRPRRLRWAQRALFMASFLAIVTAFAFMYPTGGRSGTSIDWSTLDWPLWIAVSAICYTVGVLIQLLRRLPLRRLPTGRAVPPRKDLGWIATGFGVPIVGMMVLQATGDARVQLGWIALAAAALTTSLVDNISRTVQRRRDPALTKQVDTSERRLADAVRSSLLDRADDGADRIEADFHALPDRDQALLTDELRAATLVLQRRGLIRTISREETRMIARGDVVGKRPMVPGFLLLERRVRELWRPPFWEPGSRPAVRWIISQYAPFGARDRPVGTADAERRVGGHRSP